MSLLFPARETKTGDAEWTQRESAPCRMLLPWRRSDDTILDASNTNSISEEIEDMPDASVANQKRILANQATIIANQKQIKANQETIKKNQGVILKNQATLNTI